MGKIKSFASHYYLEKVKTDNKGAYSAPGQ